jgi:DNA repair protein RadA/Sms
MAKVRRVYLCRSCGATQARWMGKCPDCGTWDSLEETVHDPSATTDPHHSQAALALIAHAGQQQAEHVDVVSGGGGAIATGAQAFAALDAHAGVHPRLPTGIHEFDRVLGSSPKASTGAVDAASVAGLVPGAAVLVGGEPGIGKSTLLLQAALAWALAGERVLYVSSEESVEQVAARARRVSEDSSLSIPPPSPPPSLFLLHDTNLARIIEQVRQVQPRVVVIDSAHMIYRGDLPAAPGSVTQLRRCGAELVALAKAAGIAVVLVAHVTKDGTLAGPRLLEHMVDTVMRFEGDRAHSHRVVRCVKNRYGSTLEIGLFEMTGRGLVALADSVGGGIVATLRGEPRPGCAITPILTGTRCVLVEVQALTATGFLGAAKRKVSGLDASRVAMLIAVLEQHAGQHLADRDIFASSVGGLRVTDPSADLAILLAIAGAHLRRSLPARCVAVGEVGLTGELRPVGSLEQRVREAVRLGAETLIIPASVDKRGRLPKDALGTAHLIAAKTINDAVGVLA